MTCDDFTRIMIDCGHNSTTSWYPGSYLRQQQVSCVERLVITNYDEDHVSGIKNLFDNVYIPELWRNNSVSASVLKYLKSEDGMGNGINFLVEKIANTFISAPPDTRGIFQGVTQWQCFMNSYPHFDDENNLSLVAFFKCHGVGVLFPGDLEAKGWRTLMQDSNFCNVLRQTNILVASHHGRENGWCEELKDMCSPFYVVISDKGYMYDTQKTIPLYSSIARGGPFRSQTRKVLTTRNDGRIGFSFTGDGWEPY